MKKTATLLILIIHIACFQAVANGSGKTTSDDTKHSQAILKMEGKIHVVGYHVPQYYIDVYQDNDLVRTMKVSRMGSFELVLNRNRLYTLEISGLGYLTKRIQINTKVPNGFAMMQSFGFDIYLAEEEIAEGVDDFMLDFPVAQICFSPDVRGFAHNEAYTKHILDHHINLFGESEQLKMLYSKK